jgi:fibronectin-binding autotransporter adhesin
MNLTSRRINAGLAALAIAVMVTRAAGSDFYYTNNANGTWDTTSPFWAATQTGSPTLMWQNGSTNRAFLDIAGATSSPSRTVTLNEDGITAQSLLFDGSHSTSNNQTWTCDLATPQGPAKTLTLNSGTITFNFVSGNNVGVINAQVDTNISAVDTSVNQNPIDLTVLVAGTDTTTSAFGNTTLTLNGANTFRDLHIGGGILGPGSAAPANTVFIQNSAGIASTSNVYLDTGNAGNGASTSLGGASFAVGTSTGNAVNVAINNLILNNGGTYSSTQFFRVGAAQFTQLDINGTISGPGDLMFAAGFSGGAGTVVLHSQSAYGNGASGSTTTFNAAGSSATGPGVIQSAIDNALPTSTRLVWGFNTNGNGGTLDLNSFNQTVSSVFSKFGAGNSVITNNDPNGTSTSVLTISGSDSPGVFSVPIVDGASGGKVALVRSGTGTTVLGNPANTYSGGTTLLGGTLSIGADTELGSPTALTNTLVINGGTLAISGTMSLNSGRIVTVGPAVGSGSGMISVAAGANATFNGVIANNAAGTGGLTLTGAGTFTLGGTNTYTGPTLINSGSLAVPSSGSLSNVSVVTIASGGTLSGAGTVGPVTVNGIIAPGTTTTPGTLSVSSLTLSGGGSYNWKLGDASGAAGTGWDLINVNGGLGPVTLNNTPASTFTINLLGPNVSNFDDTQSHTFQILSGGVFAGNGFDASSFSLNTAAFPGSDPGSTFSLVSSSNGSLSLVYTPGPTPLIWKAGTGGPGNWSNSGASTDWSNGAWSPGSSAAFNQGNGAVTLSEPISAVGIRFNVGGYTITGTGPNTLTSSAFSVTNTADVDTISAQIVGNSGLTLRGAGTLVLTGANTYTGTTTIVSGTLQVTTNSLPTDVVNNGTLTFAQTADGTFTRNISGSGTMLVNNQSNKVLTLAGTNTSTGPVQINGGVVSIDSDARLGNSTAVTLNGGTLRFSAPVTAIAPAAGAVTRTINIGDGVASSPTGMIDTGSNQVILSGGSTTVPQIVLTNSGTFQKVGTGELQLINSGFTHPSGFPPGTVYVDQGKLTLGNPTNPSADPSTFMGPTGLPNNLVVSEGATLETAATTTGTASLNSLNSLTINGGATGATYTIFRTTSGSPLSQSPSFTTNGSTSTPLTLGGLFTINAAGNISGSTPRLTVGALTLTADTTIQTVSNAAFSTNFTTNGLFNDNGHNLTFLGQGSSAQLPGSGIFINSNSGNSISSATGNWTLGNAAGTQGVVVSYGAPDNTALTSGNITVNNFAQLQFFTNGFTLGTVGQTLTLNGIGNEKADTNTSFDGALMVASLKTDTFKGNIALATDSIINTATSAKLTLTGAITGPGTLKKSGSGQLVILSSTNTAPVNTIVRNGTVTVGDGSSVGAGNALLPPGTLTLADTTTGSSAVNTLVNFRNETQTIGNLSSSFTATTGTISQTITLSGTDQGGTVLTVNETGNTTFGAGAVSTLTSKITGVGSLVLSNTAMGTLAFTGTNDYNGGTTINGGKLALAGGASVGSIYGGDVAINANGILGVNVAGNLVAGNPFPPAGAGMTATALINAGGTMSVDSDFDASVLVDPTSVGILALSTNNSTLSGTNGSSAFIGAIGSQSLTTTTLAPGAGNTYRLGGRGGTLTVTNGVLTGAANNLIVGSTQPNGFGAVVLGASNTFGGGTTVNNGTLRTTADGALSSGPLAINAGAGATSSASIQSNESVSSLSSTVSGNGSVTLSIAAGKTLVDNQTINTAFAGTLNNSGTLTKSGAGTLEITAAPSLNSGSSLVVNDTGKLRFNVNSGSSVVGTGVTVTVNNSAVLELAGTVSALSSSLISGRADVMNNSSASAGLLVTGQNQQVGGINGSGATRVNDDAQLTANHIVQSALVIGGSMGHPAMVKIAPSDANGISLADSAGAQGAGSALAGLTAVGDSSISIASITAGANDAGSAAGILGSTLASGGSPLAGDGAAVPEPSTLLLAVLAAFAAGFVVHRNRSNGQLS